ncbi:hypothetical protein EEL31_23865 [Brevibacillus laterosporus]|nr:phage tail tube protein [Brevibacillus laterosporus]TPG71168.1 hypothetical protein EEL31_23865 [Brevibacillus laterosporus]
MSLDVDKVINGTNGRAFWNNYEIFELKKVSVKVSPERENLVFCMDGGNNERLTGLKGEGTLTVGHTKSIAISKVFKEWQKMKDPKIKLTFHLSDPNNGGAETVIINDARLKDIIIMAFEVTKFEEREFPFSFNPKLVEIEDEISSDI